MDEVGFGILRVERAAVHAAAAGPANHQRRGHVPAVVRLGHHVDDLVEGAGQEVHELELRHRPQAGQRRAEGRADDGRLGDGRVDDALGAETGDKTIRHLEGSAVDADVLANAEDPGSRSISSQSPWRTASRYVVKAINVFSV